MFDAIFFQKHDKSTILLSVAQADLKSTTKSQQVHLASAKPTL